MDYITEIFSRLDIQQIREFLLHGVECVEVNTKTYMERLKEAQKPVINMIHRYFPDEMKENEKITDCIWLYSGEIEDVYMEIGLQCGFVLAMQIMSNTKKPGPRRTMGNMVEEAMKIKEDEDLD